MNVGDLVTYKAGYSFPQRVVKRIGVVVDVDRHANVVQIAWGGYGTFWDPIPNLEILK